MKIKFVTPWHSDFDTYTFVDDIWNLDGRYDDVLTHGEDYTHLVFYNHAVNHQKYRINKDRTYAIIEAPSWSGATDTRVLSYCKKIVTYEPQMYDVGRTIHYPFVGMHRLYDVSMDGEIIAKKNTTRSILSHKFEKTKTLSVIVRNHGFDSRTCTNYNKRQNLVRMLMNSDLDFDLYGFGWEFNDPRFKGSLVNKIDGIANYKYSVVLENSPIAGEITEKFMDAILCNTIPIYNGHRDVQTYYPNSCEYLDYEGNEVEKIKQIINSNNKWEDYDFEGTKNRYFNVYNPIKIIIDDILSSNT
jgi:hypothetical protein